MYDLYSLLNANADTIADDIISTFKSKVCMCSGYSVYSWILSVYSWIFFDYFLYILSVYSWISLDTIIRIASLGLLLTSLLWS